MRATLSNSARSASSESNTVIPRTRFESAKLGSTGYSSYWSQSSLVLKSANAR